MKALSTLALIALSAAVAVPNTAHAGDKERALIGGLIGGILIGTAIDSDHCDPHVSVSYRSSSHHRDGYWEWRTLKTWVPGYYERSCDRYGRMRKIWVSGRYDYHRERVWVEYSRHGHSRSYRSYDRSPHHRYSGRSHTGSDYERGDHHRDDRGNGGHYSRSGSQVANRF